MFAINIIESFFNVNPSEKSLTFKLWDELHGGLRSKRRQVFSPPGKKPRHSLDEQILKTTTYCVMSIGNNFRLYNIFQESKN